MFMSFCRLVMTSLLFLVGSCLRQDKKESIKRWLSGEHRNEALRPTV